MAIRTPGQASSGRASLAEYLRTGFEPDAEYVDGSIEARPVGEYDHSAWQEAIQFWFRQHAAEWQVRAKAELRLQVSPTRFRVPDVMVLDRRLPKQRIITQPPLAVFEVLSPEDSLARLAPKLQDYAEMGIGQIWVVDPAGPSYLRYLGRNLRREMDFGAPGDAIHFAWSAVAASLD